MPRSGRKIGADFEWSVAKAAGGTVYPGQDGDVEARGWRLECKSRAGLKLESTTTLRDWCDQISGYEVKNPEKPFALIVTGGGSYQRGRKFAMMDFDRWLQLTDPASPSMLLVELTRIRELLESRV